MYIGDWLERGERYWPDSLAVVDAAKGPSGRFTYRTLNQRANRLAYYLRSTVGIHTGDRVSMLALNGVEYLDAFFACGKLGAVLVPFNWRSHWKELVELLADTTPKALLYSDDFRESVARLRLEAPSLTHCLHLDGPGLSNSLPYEAIIQAQPLEPITNDSVEAEDIICLLFTGGTTGLPKGAQI